MLNMLPVCAVTYAQNVIRLISYVKFYFVAYVERVEDVMAMPQVASC